MKLDIFDLPTSKIVLFLFNFLLMLIGVSYIGLGGWLSNKDKINLSIIDDLYKIVGAITLALGCFSVLLSFYGYFVSIWRNMCSLIVYTTLIIIAFLYGISIGIVGYSFADNFGYSINNTLNDEIFNSADINKISIINKIQQKYSCCGLNNGNDWVVWLNQTNYPKSCCSSDKICINPSDYYQRGCLSTVTNTVKLDILISGGLTLGIVLPLSIGIIIAIATIIELKQKERLKYEFSKA